MKIRNGFVSNSSSSSFIIRKYKKNNNELSVKDFLIKLLSDNDMSQHYRNIEVLINNLKYIKDEKILFYIAGDYDDTEITTNDKNEILINSSNHYEWENFLSQYYDFEYDGDEGEFSQNWYSNTDSDDEENYDNLKNKIFLPKYGLLFDNHKYGTCKKCQRFSKLLILNDKEYCEYCDEKNLSLLLRANKIKTILE
jgi:hypothetical protein